MSYDTDRVRLPDGLTVQFAEQGGKVDDRGWRATAGDIDTVHGRCPEEPMQVGSAYYDVDPVLGVRVTR
jgi:hypothetical protein